MLILNHLSKNAGVTLIAVFKGRLEIDFNGIIRSTIMCSYSRHFDKLIDESWLFL